MSADSKAYMLRQRMRFNALRYEGVAELGQGEKGAIIGYLTRALGGNDARHIVLAWLFTGEAWHPLSTKNLTNGQWQVIKEWIGAYNDEEGWHTQPNFEVEAAVLLNAALLSIVKFGAEEFLEEPLYSVAVAMREYQAEISTITMGKEGVEQ